MMATAIRPFERVGGASRLPVQVEAGPRPVMIVDVVADRESHVGVNVAHRVMRVGPGPDEAALIEVGDLLDPVTRRAPPTRSGLLRGVSHNEPERALCAHGG